MRVSACARPIPDGRRDVTRRDGPRLGLASGTASNNEKSLRPINWGSVAKRSISALVLAGHWSFVNRDQWPVALLVYKNQ